MNSISTCGRLTALALSAAALGGQPAALAQTRPTLEGLQAQINELKALAPTYRDATGRLVGVAAEGGVLVRMGDERVVFPLAPPESFAGVDQRSAYAKPVIFYFEGRDCLGAAYVPPFDDAGGSMYTVPLGVRRAFVLRDSTGGAQVYVESSGIPYLSITGSKWERRTCVNTRFGAEGFLVQVMPAGSLSDFLVEPLKLR